jgi:hypothetical protein
MHGLDQGITTLDEQPVQGAKIGDSFLQARHRVGKVRTALPLEALEKLRR